MPAKPLRMGAFVALMLTAQSLAAQQGTVTGRVTDRQSGQPLSSVQVFISSNSMGAITQQDGRFLLLNVPAGTYSVSAQLIGYVAVTQEVIVVGGATVVQDFGLTQSALGLDEIIVTGTPGGTQRRAVGNSVTSVDASNVTQNVAVTGMQDLLTGRSPGLQFSRASGNVGTGSPIEIRGTGSFNLRSDPLIYVDGVRVNNNSQSGPLLGDYRESNPLDDFNPQDIESIEIIKGPAAATLYGTEASAGVIQIITKRGAEGRPQYSASMRQGVNYLRDPAGRLGTRWACQDKFSPPCREGQGLVSYNPYVEGSRLIHEGYFDWPHEDLYTNGHSQSYNMDVRGGTQTVRYFVSANYDDDNGIKFYNWDKAFRMRANLGLVLTGNLSLDISTGYVDGSTRYGQPAQGDGGIWEDLQWGNGYCVPRISGGNPCPRLLGFQEHLPTDVAKIEATRDYSRFTGSGTLNFSTGGWFTSRFVAGVDRGWDENRQLFPIEAVLTSVYPRTTRGYIRLERPQTMNLSFDFSNTARLRLNETWGTATSLGFQYHTKEVSIFGNTGEGFAHPLSRTVNQTPPSNAILDYDYVDNRSLGFYVQEEVSYKDRIFVTAAVRFDDNSAFGSDFEPVKYPKLAATWVVSEEGFWNVGLVNSLRVRGAWGKAGRQPDAFAGTSQYGVIPAEAGGTALVPIAPGNPLVGPETSTELEVGFEMAVLNDRVSGEFSYFTQRNESALLGVPLPPSDGFPGTTQRNLGRIDNWGWEASVNSRIYEGRSMSFNLGLTGSHVDNEIKDLGTFRGTNSIRIGFPYPNYTSPTWVEEASFNPAGNIFNDYGERLSALCDAGVPLGDTPQHGRTTGGELIPCQQATNRRLLVGPAFATYTFSVSPQFTMLDNALAIHMMADGQYGRTNFENGSAGCYLYNNCKEARVQDDPLWLARRHYLDRRDSGLFDADFWKLREIGVRYNIPQSLSSRFGADRASLTLSGRELAILWQEQPYIYSLKVADPESARPVRGDANFRVMPPLTSFNIEMRVSF